MKKSKSVFGIVLHKIMTPKSDLNNKWMVNTWPNGVVPYEIDESFAKMKFKIFDNNIDNEFEYDEQLLNVLESAFE